MFCSYFEAIKSIFKQFKFPFQIIRNHFTAIVAVTVVVIIIVVASNILIVCANGLNCERNETAICFVKSPIAIALIRKCMGTLPIQRNISAIVSNGTRSLKIMVETNICELCSRCAYVYFSFHFWIHTIKSGIKS